MMEEIKLSTGIKKIAIKDEEGEVVTVLSVNVADAGTADKFARIINELNGIYGRCEEEADQWKKDHEAVAVTEENKIPLILEVNRIRVKYLNQIINSIDELFGEGTIKKIYGEIVPDENALMEFIEQIIPVMSSLFNKRFEQTKKRYNSGRKGARA